MGTLGELKTRILDETKRPSLTSQVAKAITDAIEFYAIFRFPFNEALDETITSVAGTAAYTVPANFRNLILAEITVSGQRSDLAEGMGWEEYRAITRSANSFSQPTDIVFYGSDLYLYPTPADAYLLSLSYCSKLDDFVDDTSANAWTGVAEPLIRNRAKALLYAEVIRSPEEAAECAGLEREWLGRLQTRTAGYGRRKTVQAMSF